MTDVLYPGDVLTVLYDRQAIATFHWAICVVHNDTEAAKYNVIGSDTDQWQFEEPLPQEMLLVSDRVAIAVKIGHLDATGDRGDALLDILRPIPMTVTDVDRGREERFTCRVWWREAIRRLYDTGVIECTSVDKLEEECKVYGMKNLAKIPGWEGYQYRISEYST